MNTVERNKKRAAENKDIHILFSEGREHTVKGISFFRGGADSIWDSSKFMFIYSKTTSLELERLQSCISGTRSWKISSPSDSWAVLYIKNTSTSGKRAQRDFKLVLSGGMATAGAETNAVAWTSAWRCQFKKERGALGTDADELHQCCLVIVSCLKTTTSC